MRIARAVLALALTGCAGHVIKDRMPTYVGRPVSDLVAVLGFPTEDRVIAGKRVYVWSTSFLQEGTTMDCKVRAILDERSIVTATDFEGNERGCEGMAQKLR